MLTVHGPLASFVSELPPEYVQEYTTLYDTIVVFVITPDHISALHEINSQYEDIVNEEDIDILQEFWGGALVESEDQVYLILYNDQEEYEDALKPILELTHRHHII